MRILYTLALIGAICVPVDGHHSFAAYYFEDQTVSLEGVVVEFDYRAPHAWLYVNAPDPAGQVQRFAAEWGSPNRLARDGITKDTLQSGDRVKVTGSPGRNAEERKIHLKGIERPEDGWSWRGRRRR